MLVQAVTLVDENGLPVSAGIATALATLTTPVVVSAATAPTVNQVLTATSGSAATWQASASGFANPMTTLGDIIYENATPAPARLAGGTVATKQYLTQTGTGSASAAPAWATIVSGDLPAATTSAQGAVELDGTAGDIKAAGTAAAGATGKAADAGHVHPSTPVTSQTLGTAAANITFSAIPSGYSLLRIVVVGSSAAAAESDRWFVVVNADTNADYDGEHVTGGAAVLSAAAHAGQTGWLGSSITGVGDMPGASATAGVAGLLEITIPLYTGTTFQKTGFWRSGFADGAAATADCVTETGVVAWRSTSAITSVKIATVSGGNLIAGTTAYLYLS
jgi:hypothetical protein